MAKITVSDECFSPVRAATLSYNGPDPYGVVKKVAEYIKPYFHLTAIGALNTRINWDVSDNPALFYTRWEANRKMSRFSKFVFTLIAQGEVNQETNKGNFSLQIEASIDTDIKGWGPILRPFWLWYSYVFYNKRRQEYLKICKNNINGFINELKKHFNLGYTEIARREGTVD